MPISLPDPVIKDFSGIQRNLDLLDSKLTPLLGLLRFGTGSPENVVTANIGTIYFRADGGAGTSIYVKESGTGNTGWVGK